MAVLYMDENELTKTELLTQRIRDFYTSGLSRKEWYLKHPPNLLPGHSPVMIYLSESVRIEIGKDCPCELLGSLIHTLKTYA